MNATDCTRTCWIVATAIGLLVWIFTSGIGSMRWFEGLLLGLVACLLLGGLLVWLICQGHPARDGAEWNPEPGTAVGKPSVAAPMAVTGLPNGSAAMPSVTPAGEAIPPARDGHANGSRERADPEVADNVRVPATGDDDLKRIKGVGPKLEEVLHDHGITRFAQIAEWDDAQIDRFAEILGRMGSRIRSDDWVGQARLLERGEETEFSRRVEKGGVYE